MNKDLFEMMTDREQEEREERETARARQERYAETEYITLSHIIRSDERNEGLRRKGGQQNEI